MQVERQPEVAGESDLAAENVELQLLRKRGCLKVDPYLADPDDAIVRLGELGELGDRIVGEAVGLGRVHADAGEVAVTPVDEVEHLSRLGERGSLDDPGTNALGAGDRLLALQHLQRGAGPPRPVYVAINQHGISPPHDQWMGASQHHHTHDR